MPQSAPRSLDHGARRNVTAVSDFPRSDEAGGRIVPWIARHLFAQRARCDLARRIDPVVEMIRCRDEDVSIMDLELPRFLADSTLRPADDCAWCDVAIVQPVENDDLVGV